jgi:hypothetical protein
VQHEEFAKRAAERLEAIAKAIEDEERPIRRGEVSARAIRDAGGRTRGEGRIGDGDAEREPPVRRQEISP